MSRGAVDRSVVSPLVSPLLLGGSGVVGSAGVAALRKLQPDLPITIGARNLARAEAVAARTPGTDAVTVDIARPDLGLRDGARHSAVVTLLEDDTLEPMRWAQRHGVPYLAFSDYLFEVAPKVAAFVHAAANAPVLLLGHCLGGIMVHHALDLGRQLRAVERVQVVGILHDDDVGGPATANDVERGGRLVHPPLRIDGRWQWSAQHAERTIRTADGVSLVARAYPLLDVASLAAATDARTVRFDLALRPAATRRAGTAPSFEIQVEVAGVDPAGARRELRRVVVSQANLSVLSGYGMAIALERLLGLAGGPRVAAGLHDPATLLDPTHALARLALLDEDAAART